jgi:hypothetical protein
MKIVIGNRGRQRLFSHETFSNISLSYRAVFCAYLTSYSVLIRHGYSPWYSPEQWMNYTIIQNLFPFTDTLNTCHLLTGSDLAEKFLVSDKALYGAYNTICFMNMQ